MEVSILNWLACCNPTSIKMYEVLGGFQHLHHYSRNSWTRSSRFLERVNRLINIMNKFITILIPNTIIRTYSEEIKISLLVVLFLPHFKILCHNIKRIPLKSINCGLQTKFGLKTEFAKLVSISSQAYKLISSMTNQKDLLISSWNIFNSLGWWSVLWATK